jgi:hypothetical protein
MRNLRAESADAITDHVVLDQQSRRSFGAGFLVAIKVGVADQASRMR